YKEYISYGQKLVKLHLNYEDIEPYTDLKIELKSETPSYRVEKMRIPKYRNTQKKLVEDLSTIHFNKDIKITEIPLEAYDYIVNGQSAIKWIIDQYQVKTDGKTTIKDDPNEYSNDPKYIYNLLLSIINVSMQTVE